MSDSDNPELPKPKESINQFILRVANPYELETEGLGLIFCHYLTMKNWREFLERQKNINDVSDFDLVKIYFGCVSGVPVNAEDKLPGPLALDQVAKLTDKDIVAFARSYLTNIVKTEIKDDPVKQMGDFIREERKKNEESTKKLTEVIKNTYRLTQTSELMKGWKTLSDGVSGSITTLNEQLESMFKPSALTRSAIGEALKKLSEEQLAPIAKINKSLSDTTNLKLGNQFRNGGFVIPDIKPLEMPGPYETFGGRTANAVESLVEAGEQVKNDVGIIVIQAGRAADVISVIPEIIEKEAKSSQVFAKRALVVAAVSFVVSAAALAGSFYYANKSFRADRVDARSSDVQMKQVIQELKAQNELLRQIEKQKQPSVKTKQQVPAPPGKGR